ncbi:hypothetical protein COX05_04105 [candidate division WWE3 bacterium CG22_combo_CG10-13_8_21_14_all_39_12]|uniref:Uncharacterized protein n=2 Tax=Katanobacteria TaxID=422282 RepID=A0A2M7X0S1_UNCKA|nr:MAG: hypothetical protein COX05_04105 [candidate division WWE3 bacterium CG22_combo_CG10-13_8_21_14_all_39_12]PJA39770.1 MAG: hypothetical protein CO179_04515 [candidate division WWE3 bacterium CG_4_9_14_3_um_filter_39_7]
MPSDAKNTSEHIVEQLLSEGNREIAELVLEKLTHELGTRIATVYFAGELSEDAKKKMEESTKKSFPRAHSVDFVEDKDLIGGIKVVFEDYVYEDSTRKRLAEAM